MSKLKFRVVKQRGNARAGELTLNGVTLQTPVFMPVGTKATIKGMILDMLQDPHYIGDLPAIQLILANTFHLYLRPGARVIKQAGGIHRFEHRNSLILTDSGGFQVFSLGLHTTRHSRSHQTHEVRVKLHDDGVSFSSPFDGSKHFFSPRTVVDIQSAIGSDIMMMLDVCSPSGSSKDTYAAHMSLTHQWAEEQSMYMDRIYHDVRGVLFPIVQGGSYLDLREESIRFLSSFACDGIAVGGVSVGEEEHVKRSVIGFCGPQLPDSIPRYLMGVGTPEDLLYSVEQGFDMFDCVLATRLGRHGVAFSDHGNIKLKNACFREDFSLLTDHCACYACKSFSKSYLHHLIQEKEMLAGILLSLHNIVYLHGLLCRRRHDLVEGL